MKKIFKINSKSLFIIILITVILTIYTYNQLLNISQSIDFTFKKNIKLRNDCDAIYKEIKQHSIYLDGKEYPKHVYLHQNTSINFDCLNKNNETKIISMRTEIFKNKFMEFETGLITPFLKNNCPVTNCEFTNDEFKLNKSHLVLFEMGTNTYKFIPSRRLSNQRYVFVLYESPANTIDFSQYNNFFNLTSTYESNSDFPGFYSASSIKWATNESFNENYDFSAKKFKFSAAVISNCNDKSSRLNYINELNKYISVDIFGNCGKPCPQYYTNTSIKDECKRIISKEYKFILSFENSVCKDYITEKFFNILSYDIIPVVRGGAHYDEYVPKSGYIDAHDFKSAQDLAQYLIYLDSNKTAYNSYFKWKKHVQFYTALNIHYGFSPICDMCIYLHLEDFFGIKKKIINDPHPKSYCKYYYPLLDYLYLALIVIAIIVNFLIISNLNISKHK
jgi:hypothetical protein